MEKVIINSYEEFEKLVGQQIGVSVLKWIVLIIAQLLTDI